MNHKGDLQIIVKLVKINKISTDVHETQKDVITKSADIKAFCNTLRRNHALMLLLQNSYNTFWCQMDVACCMYNSSYNFQDVKSCILLPLNLDFSRLCHKTALSYKVHLLVRMNSIHAKHPFCPNKSSMTANVGNAQNETNMSIQDFMVSHVCHCQAPWFSVSMPTVLSLHLFQLSLLSSKYVPLSFISWENPPPLQRVMKYG